MQLIGKASMKWRIMFRILAFGPHEGIKVKVLKRHDQPDMVGGVVRLPDVFDYNDLSDREQMAKSFLHELQHAIDYKTGDLWEMSVEDAERKARQAENRYKLYR